MDCYIFEGQKILYRVSLAIVQHFSKSKYLINHNYKNKIDFIFKKILFHFFLYLFFVFKIFSYIVIVVDDHS